jgi:hypothetical protein
MSVREQHAATRSCAYCCAHHRSNKVTSLKQQQPPCTDLGMSVYRHVYLWHLQIFLLKEFVYDLIFFGFLEKASTVCLWKTDTMKVVVVIGVVFFFHLTAGLVAPTKQRHF